MSNLKTASVLAFERNLDISDAFFAQQNSQNKDSKAQPVTIKEKSVRGTISNRLKNPEKIDPAKLDAEIEKVIADFLLAGPVAACRAKELINRVVRSETIEDARDYTCEMISKARASNEGQEGMSALLEKRKASWY